MTPLFKRLGFLLVLAGIWMAPARAANAPLVLQVCNQTLDNGAHVYSGVKCNLVNTASGNTILMTAYVISGTTITATESFTCPAGAQATRGSSVIMSCYVVTASSHSQFAVDLSGAVTNPGVVSVTLEEVQGLGAIDSSASAAAASNTVNVTTAATNEWVHAGCLDLATTPNGIAPNSPFTQLVESASGGGTNWMDMTERYIQPSATTFAAACTFTGGSVPMVTALAFAQSSPPVVPAINIVKWCTSSDTDTAEECVLNNVTSGNKIVFMQMGQQSGTATSNCSINGSASSSNCVCPSAAQIHQHYTTPNTNDIGVVICYQDAASSYTTFNPLAASNDSRTIVAMEISGLNTGIDAGSEGGALAQTINYTTALANEWTFCAADDIPTSAAAAMIPGNSFAFPGTVTYSNNSRGVGFTNAFGASKVTVASGTNTCSYTYSNNLHPQIVVAAFGFTAPQTSSNHSAIF
jgi:hypothetical protein